MQSFYLAMSKPGLFDFFCCFGKAEFGLSDGLLQGLGFLNFIFGSQSDRHELRSTGLIK